MSNYLSHMNSCLNSTDFCSWLRSYQKAVWHRIGYSRLRGLKVYETAITQNLVFDLALKNFSNVQILESKDEKANGSDLLIDICCDKGSRKFAVQAKIAYKNESFPMIGHVVKKTNSRQIDLLINFAKNNGLHPAYMFYGYKKSSLNDNYGISISDANTIRINYLPTPFSVIIPTMVDLIAGGFSEPAHDVLCCKSKNAIFGFNGNPNEHVDQNLWGDFNQEGATYEKLRFKEVNDEGFNPAYFIKIIAG